MGFISLPDFVRNKEVIRFNFSLERERRNAEISISRTEIVVIFRIFV